MPAHVLGKYVSVTRQLRRLVTPVVVSNAVVADHRHISTGRFEPGRNGFPPAVLSGSNEYAPGDALQGAGKIAARHGRRDPRRLHRLPHTLDSVQAGQHAKGDTVFPQPANVTHFVFTGPSDFAATAHRL